MNTQEVRDDLFDQLVRRGLRVEYARRASEEIADHHGDLIEELCHSGLSESDATTEATRRLGDTRTLIKKTVREYQRRYWCGRWPLVTFLFGPIVLLFGAWLATILVAGLCILLPMYLMGFDINPPHDGVISVGEYAMNYVYIAWNLFAVPTLVMYGLARLASRAALGPGWICLGATVLAMFVGLWVCDFPGDIRTVDRVTPADEFMVVIGLPMAESWQATWRWYTRDFVHICQFLLPLGIAGLMTLRMKQLSQRAAGLVAGEC
jgi:hypothetical protein